MAKASTNKKYKSLLSNTLAFTISNFASKILVFLLIPLYTSVLSINEYGVADLITNTVNVLYPVLTLSIMEATLRFAFDSNLSRDEVLCNSLFIILISEGLIGLCTFFIGGISETLAAYWGWVAVIFFGYNLHQVLSQYSKGIGKTKVFAISGVVQTVTIIVCNIVGLLVLKWGLTAYLFAIAAGYFITSFYIVIAANIKVKVIRINGELLREMLKFSIPMIPTIVAWWISSSADKYIIIGYLGLAMSGIYSVSYKIPSIMTMFTNIFTSAWTISAIENVNEKDNSQFQKTVYDLFNAVNVLACGVLILLCKLLARFLFAKEFFEAWHCVPMLLLAYVFAGMGGFMASSFRAVKYTKGLFSSTIAGALANIVLNFFFIKMFGIMGAAFTTMIGFAVTFYIRSHTMQRIVNIKINLLKDSLIYLLLAIDAYLIGHELRFSYVVGILTVLIITAVYYRVYLTVINKGIAIIQHKILKR